MKIEFLKEGSPDCPLVRIFGSDSNSAAQLASAFKHLANGEREEIAIHALPSFQSIDGCKLSARLSKKDIGVRAVGAGNDLECVLRQSTWDTIAELIEPFMEPVQGVRYHWLDQTSEISLLFSTSDTGEW